MSAHGETQYSDDTKSDADTGLKFQVGEDSKSRNDAALDSHADMPGGSRIYADLTQLDYLPKLIKSFAAVLVVEAICVTAVVPFLFQKDFQSLLIWIDTTFCLPVQNWITANIGFTNTIAWLRSHIPIDFVSAIIAAVVLGFALALAFLAALNFYVAKCVKNRKHFGFALSLSYLNCLLVPFGPIAGIRVLNVSRRPANIAAFMLPDLKCELLPYALHDSALVEIIRMPNPFHVGMVLTYFDNDLHKTERTVWINGWFGVSVPMSIKATVTRQSPYFLPFFPTSGPYIIEKSAAERIERMGRSIEKHLDENLMPYSFVPGVFDGVWPLGVPGGHTSNSIVASLLHWADMGESLAKQYKIEPWFLAPGANPHALRNIMPHEWFEKV